MRLLDTSCWKVGFTVKSVVCASDSVDKSMEALADLPGTPEMEDGRCWEHPWDDLGVTCYRLWSLIHPNSPKRRCIITPFSKPKSGVLFTHMAHHGPPLPFENPFAPARCGRGNRGLHGRPAGDPLPCPGRRAWSPALPPGRRTEKRVTPVFKALKGGALDCLHGWDIHLHLERERDIYILYIYICTCYHVFVCVLAHVAFRSETLPLRGWKRRQSSWTSGRRNASPGLGGLTVLSCFVEYTYLSGWLYYDAPIFQHLPAFISYQT